MPTDQRSRNANWNTITGGNQYMSDEHYRRASLAVLMDLRDELQRLNEPLHCSNFVAIPNTLRGIRRNTAKPRKAKS